MAIPVPNNIVLGLLAIDPRHGYQLPVYFNDPWQLGAIWRLNTSQLYNVLKHLERQQLITRIETPSTSGSPRTLYNLTTAGYHQLNTWLHPPLPGL